MERAPYFVDVSADGTRAYVANAGSNSVSVVDIGQRRLLRNILVGQAPGKARVSRDGKTVVVAERLGDSVSIIDAETMTVRSSVAACRQPTDVEIMPDSGKAFITCSGSGQVAVIGLNMKEPDALGSQNAGQQVGATRQSARGGSSRNPVSARPDRLLSILDVGSSPVDLALKPDGGEIFVCNFGANTMSEILTSTNEVGASYLIGAGPVRALVSADNSTLYVSNFNSDTVSVYSIDDGKLVIAVPVGRRPDALALSPNQNFLFVADTAAGDVSVVRTAAKQGAVLLTIIPVGQQPNDIAVKAFILRKPPSAL